MADKDGLKIAKNYHTDEAFANQGGFYIKGANHLDWGMKKHLSNIFDPKSGNTVMFAFDHGYFMGSTAGLERLDIVVPRLLPAIDCLMGTRGALRKDRRLCRNSQDPTRHRGARPGRTSGPARAATRPREA